MKAAFVLIIRATRVASNRVAAVRSAWRFIDGVGHGSGDTLQRIDAAQKSKLYFFQELRA